MVIVGYYAHGNKHYVAFNGYVIKSGTREEIEKYIKDEDFEVLTYMISQKTGSAEKEDA